MEIFAPIGVVDRAVAMTAAKVIAAAARAGRL